MHQAGAAIFRVLDVQSHRKRLASLLQADAASAQAVAAWAPAPDYSASVTAATCTSGLGALCAVMASFLAEANSCSAQGDVSKHEKLTGGLHCSLQTFLQ